jgi:hypothetical protein
MGAVRATDQQKKANRASKYGGSYRREPGITSALKPETAATAGARGRLLIIRSETISTG